MKTFPSPQKTRRQTLLFALVTFIIILLTVHHQKPHLATILRLPQCKHIILVSTQRHGSTWLISNAENCFSSNGTYGNLTSNTELWNFGKVKRIGLAHAVSLLSNTSLKIFPTALYEHEDNLKKLFVEVRRREIPVFLLRRRLEDSFTSLKAAVASGVWLDDSGGRTVERIVANRRQFESYRTKVEKYFQDVERLMKELGVVWDELWYERIVQEAVIVGEKAGCYIRNCNFW